MAAVLFVTSFRQARLFKVSQVMSLFNQKVWKRNILQLDNVSYLGVDSDEVVWKRWAIILGAITTFTLSCDNAFLQQTLLLCALSLHCVTITVRSYTASPFSFAGMLFFFQKNPSQHLMFLSLFHLHVMHDHFFSFVTWLRLRQLNVSPLAWKP